MTDRKKPCSETGCMVERTRWDDHGTIRERVTVEKTGVMISIRPEWCEKILSGEKIIEVRKTKPKLKPPFKCFIYCTNGAPYLYVNGKTMRNGKVIAEFNCPHVREYGEIEPLPTWNALEHQSCLSMDEIMEYGGNASWLYGWYIAGLKTYARPKSIFDFTPWAGEEPGRKLKRPPQSWCYVTYEEEIK